MSKNNLIFLFLIFIIIACNQNENRLDNQQQDPDVRKLISKLKPIKLPFIYEFPSEVNYSKLYRPDEKNDSAFLPKFVHVFGYLPDTSNFFGIVYLYPADKIIVILRTFNKKGKLIIEKSLDVSTPRCGPACGIESCYGQVTISKNMDLKFIENINYLECDSLDDEIPGTESVLTNIQEGKIMKNGKIVLEEEIITRNKLNN